jgi:hypothetical protein
MMARLTREGQWTLEAYNFDEQTIQVELVAADVAVVAYKVVEHVTVEGRPLILEANDSSVWVRHGGEWTCALHTESVAGDPFGRDRRS